MDVFTFWKRKFGCICLIKFPEDKKDFHSEYLLNLNYDLILDFRHFFATAFFASKYSTNFKNSQKSLKNNHLSRINTL